MRNEVMRMEPWLFNLFPDRLKTKEMCEKAVENDPWLLEFVPDHF